MCAQAGAPSHPVGGQEAPSEGRDLQVLARATGGARSVIDLASATHELGLSRSTTYRYLTAMVEARAARPHARARVHPRSEDASDARVAALVRAAQSLSNR